MSHTATAFFLFSFIFIPSDRHQSVWDVSHTSDPFSTPRHRLNTPFELNISYMSLNSVNYVTLFEKLNSSLARNVIGRFFIKNLINKIICTELIPSKLLLDPCVALDYISILYI
ncbi:hypothetical protein BpHYR1_000649 [Brachionus plicatilis]|uniref:Uncharacterized protein n=1 Tax=Brachionus plicatilis TaxID=10195 RepID=A0A3M7SGX6_BRAPC|nr:hypothetical protein BpHYR1_000649 [Brachionus plicatilis]